MKKFIQIVLSCSLLAAIPLFLYIASIYPSFHPSDQRWDNRTCTRFYEGISKGVIWERGEWHHYVDFAVDDSPSAWDWTVTTAPMESTVWTDYSTTSIIRVGYQWPSNWWDPFPASRWKICLLSS